MDKKTYSMFEITMGQIFHGLYGSTTEDLDKQWFWKDIQELKKMAQEG
jgi:hypothetical protein